jgi:outer membrane immunogenic protein
MRKPLLLASALLATIGTVGFAADLPSEPVPVLPPPVVFTWTGPYLGIAGGGAWGRSEIHIPGAISDSDLDPAGWMVGIFGGYNWQNPSSWVYGVEADIEWADIQNDGSDGGVDIRTTLNWDASFRGRVGYAWDRALLYTTAGFAFAGLEGNVSPGPAADSTEWGWTAGVGADYAFTDSFFGRLEYRYTDLSDFDNEDDPGEVQDFRTHAIRAGLGWKFSTF